MTGFIIIGCLLIICVTIIVCVYIYYCARNDVKAFVKPEYNATIYELKAAVRSLEGNIKQLTEEIKERKK